MSESASSNWWLSSGGYLLSSGGIGMTSQGLLPATDAWRLLYALSNPVDTDTGYRPQNIFRIVSRMQWTDFAQEVYFRVRKTNLSFSANRDGYNGVLFLNRYKDSNNLYYAGLRVDGLAIVKKKLAGVYTTLASKRVYPGTYDRSLSPNLLPQQAWIGMRTVTTTNSNGSVSIRVEVNDPVLTGGAWSNVLEAVDSTSPITTQGYAGFRTDFMDVQFDHYRITQS